MVLALLTLSFRGYFVAYHLFHMIKGNDLLQRVIKVFYIISDFAEIPSRLTVIVLLIHYKYMLCY